MTRAVTLRVAPEIGELGLRGSYFVLDAMKIPTDGHAIDALVESAVADVLNSWSDEAIASDPILAGFGELHERVDRGGRKNVASPEALLRTVLTHQTLPRVNVAVDLYNVVSLSSRLALGAHDVAQIDGTVNLRMTNGDELFVPLGRDKPRGIGPGEYGYIDDANDIICRMETRQVEKTKVTPTTTSCFYIVQGNANTSMEHIDKAVESLVALTQEYCGGTFSSCGRVE